MAGRSDDPIGDLLAAYALNALDAEDTARVERALEEEPRYAAMLADLFEGAAFLHASHQPAIPSAALRERVIDEARQKAIPPSFGPAGGMRVPMAFWGLAASLVLAVLGTATVAFMQQQRVGELETEMKGLVAQAAEAEQRLQRSVELTELAADPAVVRAPMLPVAAPQPPNESEYGVLFSRTDGKRVLFVSNLAPLPEGQVYQAWLWEDRTHAYSLAVFTADDLGQALIPLWMPLDEPLPGRWITVHVSPEGGTVDPGNDKVLWGAVDSSMPVGTSVGFTE